LQLEYPDAIVNPLGDWSGGINVDAGATNRKLGSDMGDSITGGGLHGKDLSKGDISINIYAFLKAQELEEPVEYKCAIGDDTVNGIPFTEIVEIAREYINRIGGFEKFAEWGFI
jgi:S-adenosylmethionine synthetase